MTERICPVCNINVIYDGRKKYCSKRCKRIAETLRKKDKAATPKFWNSEDNRIKRATQKYIENRNLAQAHLEETRLKINKSTKKT